MVKPEESRGLAIPLTREQPQYYLTELAQAFACNPLPATIRRWIKTGVKFGMERPVKLEWATDAKRRQFTTGPAVERFLKALATKARASPTRNWHASSTPVVQEALKRFDLEPEHPPAPVDAVTVPPPPEARPAETALVPVVPDPLPEAPDLVRRPYTVKQVAEMFGVHAQVIYDECARRNLGHTRIGGSIRIPVLSLEEYLRTHTFPPKRPA